MERQFQEILLFTCKKKAFLQSFKVKQRAFNTWNLGQYHVGEPNSNAMKKEDKQKIKELFTTIKKTIEKIPPICQTCQRGTLSGIGVGEQLECSFCKNPKK